VRLQISRDLHDSVQHILHDVRWQAVGGQQISSNDNVKEVFATIKSRSEDGLAELRRTVHALRGTEPAVPLSQALQPLVEGFGLARASIKVFGEERALSTDAAGHLYRVVEEALTNVGKHTHATTVSIQINYESPTCLQLVIQDNGGGCDQLQRGIGIENIEWRAQRLGGTAHFYPSPGYGFRIEVEVPA
jgi:signal transduction histidine kinase